MRNFQSEDFFSVVEAHNGQPLRLYVYSSTTDQCREVTLIPNLSWGGDGMLGCEIGFGYLHRIPPPPSSTSKSPHVHPPLSGADAPGASISIAVPNNESLANQPPYQPTLMSQQPTLCNPAYPPPPSSLPPSLMPPQYPVSWFALSPFCWTLSFSVVFFSPNLELLLLGMEYTFL